MKQTNEDSRHTVSEVGNFLPFLRRLHEKIRDTILNSCRDADPGSLFRIDSEEEEGDTIYAIDRVSEDVLLDHIRFEGIPDSFILIAEGISGGKCVFPSEMTEEEAAWRVIMDPIDGTRCLMYQKRSAWILSAVAPNRGPATNLQDIQLAIQTEIPVMKQHLSDSLWVQRGGKVQSERYNRITGERIPFRPCPSVSRSIEHGYAMLSRFFPGARDILAEIDEEIVMQALGPYKKGKAHCFEDQYTSTAGQLYELFSGHDRFNADLRPLMNRILQSRGLHLGICCHPYDICTELIARELGVIVTDEHGRPLQAPLSVDADVAWIGYANRSIREQMEPLLRKALQTRNLLQT